VKGSRRGEGALSVVASGGGVNPALSRKNDGDARDFLASPSRRRSVSSVWGACPLGSDGREVEDAFLVPLVALECEAGSAQRGGVAVNA
jgi:hypothetical protein